MNLLYNDQTHLWHYDAHCPLCSANVFTVGQAGKRFVLFIDPYPWGFELRPASVVSASKWALKKIGLLNQVLPAQWLGTMNVKGLSGFLMRKNI